MSLLLLNIGDVLPLDLAGPSEHRNPEAHEQPNDNDQL